MAEELLEYARDLVEGRIDFDGQRRVEVIGTLFLSLSALVAFNVGYFYQDIIKAMYICLGGAIFTAVCTIPPWPLYNMDPVKWLPAGSGMD